MGGILINGCGASDSFVKVRDICQGFCRDCKKVQMFGLFEVKRKVRVVWIPTVTLNTKYAVACAKCKSGIYVEDRILNEILANRAEFVFDSSGNIRIYEATDSQIQAPVEPQQQAMPKRPEASADILRPDPVLSQAEESTQDSSGSVQNVGLDREGVPFFVQEKKVCPQCGLMYVSSKKQCDVCGSVLAVR